MTQPSALHDAIRIELAEGAMTPDQRLAAQQSFFAKAMRLIEEQKEKLLEAAEYFAIVEMLGAPERPKGNVVDLRRRG